MGQDGLPSDYGVEMHPGRSIWAWGVLALGAGLLLLSGWRVDSAILTAGDARSIRVDGLESDRVVLGRSVRKAGARYPLTEVGEPLSEPRLIGGDRQRNARSNRRDGSAVVETSGTLVNTQHGEVGDDGVSRSLHTRVDEDYGAPEESPRRERRSVITRADAHSNYFSVRTTGESAGGYNDRDNARTASPEFRNDDRSERVIAEEIASRSKANDPREIRGIAPRSSRVSRSWEAITGTDNDLRSSTWVLRHNSKDTDGHSIPNKFPATSRSNDNRAVGADGKSRSSEVRTSIPASWEGSSAKGAARRRFAGMREDQVLFFRGDRERVRSSAMNRAEAIGDRKDRPGEQDREDLARSRRGGGRDWFMRTSNRSEDLGGRAGDLTVGRESGSNEGSESEEARLEDTNDAVNNGAADESVDEEESSEDANAFVILDSVIPLDNKRRKATRAEDSKDLMVASNFEWSSRDRRIADKIVTPEHRSPGYLSQDTRERRPRTGRRRNTRRGATSGEIASSARRLADRRIRETIGDWRERYANYYSPESATPMAYVHIQPAFPAAPPTSRKCVRCMVVYKPCPSQPRPPPRIVLPSYKYHEPAANWRGLKYGE